jgi:hypothetical protein
MNNLLAKFIQIVVFLFAAFGGFLNEIAPPTQTNPKMIVGLGSFLVLIVLLIISAVARNISTAESNRKWIVAGCIFFVLAVVSGILYPWTLSNLTYYYPPLPDAAVAWRVNGLELTQTAKDFIDREPSNYSPAQLEQNLKYEDIWTESSLAKAKLLLLSNYLCLVLSISTAIFCLLEANLTKKRPQLRRLKGRRLGVDPKSNVQI